MNEELVVGVGEGVIESKRQIPLCLAHYPTPHCAALSAHFLLLVMFSTPPPPPPPSSHPSLQKLNYTVSVREQFELSGEAEILLNA